MSKRAVRGCERAPGTGRRGPDAHASSRAAGRTKAAGGSRRIRTEPSAASEHLQVVLGSGISRSFGCGPRNRGGRSLTFGARIGLRRRPRSAARRRQDGARGECALLGADPDAQREAGPPERVREPGLGQQRRARSPGGCCVGPAAVRRDQHGLPAMAGAASATPGQPAGRRAPMRCPPTRRCYLTTASLRITWPGPERSRTR